MENPMVKQILVSVLANYEALYCEILSMRTILRNCPDGHTRATWKQDVDRLLNDRETRAAAHAVFEPLYARIRAADDEADLKELLLRIPKWKAN